VIKAEYKSRISNVLKGIPDACEAVFLWNDQAADKNFAYLTGLSDSTLEGSALLLEKSGKLTLFSPSRDQEILENSGSCDKFVVWKSMKDRDKMFEKIFPKYHKLGLCFRSLSHASYCALELIIGHSSAIFDVTDVFAKCRLIKSAVEIEKTKRACAIVSELTVILPTFLHEGMREMDLAADVEYHMKKMGSDKPAFPTIVAFGSNTSRPHHSTGDTVLQENDIVLIDFGAEVEGYKSDITQMYFVGTPDWYKMHMHNKVLGAQEVAIKMIKDGVKSKDVVEAAKEYATACHRYKDGWIHGLGHGLGLDIHDSMYPEVFKEGMILTVEPGIYLPGKYGVRLEDDILVTKDGCEVLTDTHKEYQDMGQTYRGMNRAIK